MAEQGHGPSCDCSTCWFQKTMGIAPPAPSEPAKEEPRRIVVEGARPPDHPLAEDMAQMEARRRIDPKTGKPFADVKVTLRPHKGTPPHHLGRVHKLSRPKEGEDCCVLGKLAREQAEKAQAEHKKTEAVYDARTQEIVDGLRAVILGDEKPDSPPRFGVELELPAHQIVLRRRHVTERERREAEAAGEDCPSVKVEAVRADPALIGHTSNPEFEPLRKDLTMEALRDRTIRIDMPMPLLDAEGRHKSPPPDEYVRKCVEDQYMPSKYRPLKLVKEGPRTMEIRMLPPRQDGRTLADVFRDMGERIREASANGAKIVVLDSISPEGPVVQREVPKEDLMRLEAEWNDAAAVTRDFEAFDRERWATFIDMALMSPRGLATEGDRISYEQIRAKGEPLSKNPYALGLGAFQLLKDYERILGPVCGSVVKKPELAEPKDAVELTGDVNVTGLSTYGADSDPRAFVPLSGRQLDSLREASIDIEREFGAAVRAGTWKGDLQGFRHFYFTEILKQPPDDELLRAIQDPIIKKRLPQVDLEPLLGVPAANARAVQDRLAAAMSGNLDYIDPILPAYGITKDEAARLAEEDMPEPTVTVVHHREEP